MSDQFRIIAPQVRAAGTDVPPEQIQAALNSLAQQMTIALNALVGEPEPPSGPAGGDLGGTYPDPTVSAVHATSGTLDGVVIGGTTPAAGSFTTLSASTPVGVTSGGTGLNALTAHAVVIGEGASAPTFAAPGTAGNLLASNGASADPSFQTQAALAIAKTSGTLGQFAATTSAQLAGVISDETGSGSLVFATGAAINPASTGATTPGTGAFTTLSASGNFTPSQTSGIVGTTTNNNANAGSVGEVIDSGAVTTGSLTSGTAVNVTSIPLTAGDWDIYGSLNATPAATTTTISMAAGASTTSATLPAIPLYTLVQTPGVTAAAASAFAIPSQRLSVPSSTTVFLVAQVNFATSTCTATGRIWARRRR